MPEDPQALRERLQRLFRDELDEHVSRLEHGFDHLAQVLPDVPGDTVTELFRSAHTLKGAAQAVGASTIERLCHHLEDTLAQVRDGSVSPDIELLDRMQALVDTVGRAGGHFVRGEETPLDEVDRVLAALGSHPLVTGDVPVLPPSPARVADPPSTEEHPPAPYTHPPAAVRVGVAAFDALLARTDELITGSHRSHRLVAELSAAASRMAGSHRDWQGELQTLRRALEPAGNGTTGETLRRMIERSRQNANELEHLARVALDHQRGLARLVDDFGDAARRARTVPFSDATAGLARQVRELARQHGKRADLVVDATEVEIDKELVTLVHEVIGHLVRNCVDHGIEPPDERSAAGKPEAGTVRLTAALGTDGIEIVVSDDGRGVRARAVREAALDLGLVSSGDEDFNHVEALFQPGLSTSRDVSTVSGRGVGLDAVRSSLEGIGGSVTLRSEIGRGTDVVLRVPLTLSTYRAVVVAVGDQMLALPSASIRTLRRAPAERFRVNGRDAVSVDGETVPVADLREILGWGGDGSPEDSDPQQSAVIVHSVDGSLMLVVDRLVEEREIIVRSPPRRLAGERVLLGMTQLENGSVALVLSPAVCARRALTSSVAAAPSATPTPARRPEILLVEDTITTRELERSVLEGAGYAVVAASDGTEAWQILQTRRVDAVVSDVNMPRMDGIALCRTIRNSARTAELPVVLMTSLSSDSDRRRGLDAGADAYLTKAGFARADLLETLERLL